MFSEMIDERGGKFCMTPAAMKAGAREMGMRGSPAEAVARRAVYASLRHYKAAGPRVFAHDGSEKTLRKVTIVLGTTGAGKSEAALGWCAKEAARGAASVLIGNVRCVVGRMGRLSVSAHISDPMAWDLIRSAGEDHLNAMISTPSVKDSGPVSAESLLPLMEAIPSHSLLVLDGLCSWYAGDGERNEVMRKIHDRVGNTIMTFQDACSMVRVIGSGDGLSAADTFLMKSVDKRTAEMFRPEEERDALSWARDLLDLTSGSGFLLRDGTAIRSTAPHLSSAGEGRILSRGALNAVRILTERLGEGWPSTHTERLELMARACGYRSWHAAQGRTGMR